MRMHEPAHPGEIARDNLEAEGWTVNESAARLGVSRTTLSCLLNGRADVSAAMASALERIGWGTADHWVRMQRSYYLARYEARIAELERKVGQLVMENDLLKKASRAVEQPSGAMVSVVSGPTVFRSDEAAN